MIHTDNQEIIRINFGRHVKRIGSLAINRVYPGVSLDQKSIRTPYLKKLKIGMLPISRTDLGYQEPFSDKNSILGWI